MSHVPGVVERINGERLVLLGWPCAILMQVAHPLIAAGVAEHSTFRDSPVAPLRRLHGTIKAMLGLTFGDEGQQRRVIDTIRSIHTRVNGTLDREIGRYPAGTPYSAEDPALLLWVHATLLDTSIRLYELIVGSLTAADRDEYCRDSASVALALGADPTAVPRDWPATSNYVEAILSGPTLAVGGNALALADAILNSRTMTLSGPAGWTTRRLTVGLLPPELRRQYGLKWNAGEERRFLRVVSGLRRIRRWTPMQLARWKGSRSARSA